MHFAFWITKATNTHSENILFFTTTVVARTRLRLTFYVNCLSCYYLL